MRNWKKLWALMMALAVVVAGSARAAEDISGTYMIKGAKGDIVLTLKQDEKGGATGSLKGGELSLQLTGLPRPEGGVVGKASSDDGAFASYFAAFKQDAHLMLVLIQANADGDPDLTQATPIQFPIAGSTPGVSTPEPTMPVQSTPGGTPTGNTAFAGTFKGDGLTLESKAQGNDYTGTLTLGETQMPFTATGVNGVLHGAFEAGGERFDFRAQWQGTTLVLASGGTNYKLVKQGGANPLAKPNAPRNPLEKSATAQPNTAQPATPQMTTAQTATAQPAENPAGAPKGGAAWQEYKHAVGLALRYPPNWQATDLGRVLQLTPSNVKQVGGGPAEMFFIMADNAGPIRSGSDPQLVQHLEQQATQLLAGFTRVGAVQPIKAGNEPGVLVAWEGVSQGTPMRAQVYATVLKQFAVVMLALSTKDEIKAARDAEAVQIFASLATGAGERDPQVVGKWFLYSYKGTGTYGRESKSYMTLLPDGTAIWGQQGESSFSGQAGSFASQSNSGDRGTWSAGKGQLIVFWGDGTTGTWQYRLGGSPGGNRRLFLTEGAKTNEWMEVQ